MARRLVEAGISVVTLKVGDWDTHEKNFIDMRVQLPQLDRGLHALVTDLVERGLDQDTWPWCCGVNLGGHRGSRAAMAAIIGPKQGPQSWRGAVSAWGR